MTFCFRLLLLCLLPVAVAVAETRYHKWVDAEGNVHFSQTAPTATENPGGSSEKHSVKYSPQNDAAVESLREDVKALDKAVEDRAAAKAEEEKKAAELAAKEADCARIKQQLDILGTGKRLRDEKSGRIIPEEERQQRLQHARKLHKEDCS